jgi:class 3 adenylate cyclase/DNA-binding winged helix-turn-helix (wHTH) protein/predicted ATPase
MLYRFADCALYTRLYTLERAGQRTRLAPKVFEVLCYLIAHRDRVVSKQELCDQVWEGLAISDATLESCLRAVRISVGDSGQAQRIIQTQRGYGYRFVADVELLPADTAPPPLPLEATPHPLTLPPPSVRPCAACHYPNPAAATFCTACGMRLHQPCAYCGQDILLPAAFCTACGQPRGVPSPPASVVSPAAAPAPPQSAGTLSDQRGGGVERKLVTVLCYAVARTAAGGASVDLDTLYSVMQELHALAHDVVRPYGGRLHTAMGDCLLILFGVPVAHEDDARRAVHVALELRRRLAVRQEQLGTTPGASPAWRMGLHTGLVVVEGMRNGDDTATAATVVGDVVAVATALAERAAPGTIVCSDATAHLLQGTVRLEAQGPLQVPGQPAPVTTYAVLGRRVRHSPVEPPRGRVLSPFVGREREMATLHALLAQAEAGHGQVVGVVGEPGLGKSRLVYEFRRSLGRRRLTYRAGRCLSYGTTTPYLPVLDLLRHHYGIMDTDEPEAITAKIHHSLQEVDMAPERWAPVLLHLLGLEEGTNPLAALSPEARKARILTALTQMCLNGSRQRPLILELEDLHWSDASSDECLAALVERMVGAPLLVLVTYRPGYRPAWMDRSYVTQIALQPLTSQDSLRVVQAVLPTAAFTAPLVPQLLAKAEGNPFFLEELARTVVEQDTDVPSPTVPDTVQAVLLARMDRLLAPAKRLLQTAAVIGKDVTLPLLQAVTAVPEEALHRDLGHLQAAGFLCETYTPPALAYTFKHALTQEVAYQSLVRRARQQYHAHIAQVLEERFPEVAEAQPELLAYHYTEAGLGEQALPYWQRAGQRAVERSAYVEAIGHFTKAREVLTALPDTPERMQRELELQTALGAALMATKGYLALEVEAAYARAYELCRQLGEPPQLVSVLMGLSGFYLMRGEYQRACELGEQVLTLGQSTHDPTLLTVAHASLGSIQFWCGELRQARVHVEQGTALYDPQQHHSLALRYGQDPGVGCLSYGALILELLGYPDQALGRSREALILAQGLVYPFNLARALAAAAIVHQLRREAQQTREQAEAAIVVATEQGFPHWVAWAITMRGWALVELGEPAEGIEQLHQALALWRTAGSGHAQLYGHVLLAEGYGKAGQPAEGLHVLAEVLTTAHQLGQRFCGAELYRLQGELLWQSTAQALACGGFNPPSGLDSPPEETAETCFYEALAIARHQQAKTLELRAAMSMARLWQRQGKRTDAYELLVPVYGWFTEGFDTPDLQEAQALLGALQ